MSLFRFGLSRQIFHVHPLIHSGFSISLSPPQNSCWEFTRFLHDGDKIINPCSVEIIRKDSLFFLASEVKDLYNAILGWSSLGYFTSFGKRMKWSPQSRWSFCVVACSCLTVAVEKAGKQHALWIDRREFEQWNICRNGLRRCDMFFFS